MTLPFGAASSGLLQRRRPTRISAAEVRDAADAVLPALAAPGLRMAVRDSSSGGALLVVEEDERRVQAHLGDLAEDMADAGVSATPAGIAAALSAWVAGRPVTDSVAATTGVAALDWTDATRTAVSWRVLVRRGRRVLAWSPSWQVDGARISAVRAAAARRALDVRLHLQVEGPVALWSHPTTPVLATAALIDPERMRARIAATGLQMPDMQVVVTPRRTVACAGPAVAARLAAESVEACVRLASWRLADLRWR